MSATGRNLAGNERRTDDFYETPGWCTELILPKLWNIYSVLDPCCGKGAILDIAREMGAVKTAGIELDGERAIVANRPGHDVMTGNALVGPWPYCTSIVTNPPYTLAMEFIVAAQTRCSAVERAFLLRLGFLGSQKRASFHREHPADVYVLSRRPPFTGRGTDATEYAWFVWGPGRGGRWEILA